MPELAIKIRGLCVSYGTLTALHDLDLDIERNRVTAIIGPSGAGKTTLLRALAEDLPATASTSGEVAVADGDPHGIEPSLLVPQLPIGGHRRLGSLVSDPRALDAVGLPTTSIQRRLRDLTRPERQLASIARLLSAAPRLWLLDQPTSALDADGTARVEEVLWDARAHHTVLLVTHELAQARRASDACALLVDGTIVEQAATARLFVRPEDPRTAAFVEGRRLDPTRNG